MNFIKDRFKINESYALNSFKSIVIKVNIKLCYFLFDTEKNFKEKIKYSFKI